MLIGVPSVTTHKRGFSCQEAFVKQLILGIAASIIVASTPAAALVMLPSDAAAQHIKADPVARVVRETSPVGAPGNWLLILSIGALLVASVRHQRGTASNSAV
jgi:hypothetical protein